MAKRKLKRGMILKYIPQKRPDADGTYGTYKIILLSQNRGDCKCLYKAEDGCTGEEWHAMLIDDSATSPYKLFEDGSFCVGNSTLFKRTRLIYKKK